VKYLAAVQQSNPRRYEFVLARRSASTPFQRAQSGCFGTMLTSGKPRRQPAQTHHSFQCRKKMFSVGGAGRLLSSPHVPSFPAHQTCVFPAGALRYFTEHIPPDCTRKQSCQWPNNWMMENAVTRLATQFNRVLQVAPQSADWSHM
jgi:hypothetical protein